MAMSGNPHPLPAVGVFCCPDCRASPPAWLLVAEHFQSHSFGAILEGLTSTIMGSFTGWYHVQPGFTAGSVAWPDRTLRGADL